MMRISTIFFCILLAAAAAGRYRAEANVRAYKAEIRKIESEIEAHEEKISELDIQVESLEGSERLLRQLTVQRMSLASVKPYQLQTAREFAGVISVEMPTVVPATDKSNEDFIVNAIAMADFEKGK